MKKQWIVLFAFAGVLTVLPAARAATINEDFSTDPLQHGWQAFGNAGLFNWDAPSHQLAVTWDSTKPNSYFYHALDGYLTRYDDFTFEFDLRLDDIASNTEPGKTGPLQIGIGFQNYSAATNASVVRGFGAVSDVAEFNYFPHGFYDFGVFGYYDSPPHSVPSFVSTQSAFSPNEVNPWYILELPTNVVVHVTMTFMASNQTATLTATTNGIPVGLLPDLVLDITNNSNFKASDDYHADMFSITSYTSIGDPYDSILAHGAIANLHVDLPPPAQNLAGAFSNGTWQVQFTDRTNWLYTLERTTNFVSWGDASLPAAGNGTTLVLEDTNAPANQASYRVRANRP